MPELSFLPDLEWLRPAFLGQMLLATVLGGAIGLEREWSGKPAGFRTNLLICVGAALLTDLSVTVAELASAGTAADPGRIAAQIVSGVGFLGAGTIIQSRVGVRGLTTAATLWVVAAIGMTVGAGAYAEALVTTALVVLTLLLLGRVESWLPEHSERRVRVSMAAGSAVMERVESILEGTGDLDLLELERGDEGLTATYRVTGRRREWRTLVSDLMGVEGVRTVKSS